MCAIYLKQGDELVEMVEERYEAEAVLQQLLADYPNLLGGDQDSEPRKRWLLVRREIGIPGAEAAADRFSVDHLFLDETGVPTLVEVKRSTDTRIRREVVGQMLDYAANASSYWALEGIRAAFEARHEDLEEAERALSTFLKQDADAADGFWERVGVNLQAGKLRLVFVADEIPSELRRVIEFLNEQMSTTEVLGLEVRQLGRARRGSADAGPATDRQDGGRARGEDEGSAIREVAGSRSQGGGHAPPQRCRCDDPRGSAARARRSDDPSLRVHARRWRRALVGAGRAPVGDDVAGQEFRAGPAQPRLGELLRRRCLDQLHLRARASLGGGDGAPRGARP